MINEVKNLHLIRVLGWDNFYRTSIKIHLPIILYLFYI